MDTKKHSLRIDLDPPLKIALPTYSWISPVSAALIRARNRKDWVEVPAEVRARMKVHFVRHISELFPIALLPK